MSVIRFIYLSVFILAFIFGIKVYKYNKALQILVGLLALGLITEIWVEINKSLDLSSEEFIYNIYIPLEYFFYTSFFYFINDNKILKKIILISIPLFALTVILFAEYNYIYTSSIFSKIYNTGGFLAVIWSLWTLFILKPVKNIRLSKHSLFWICVGIIIFHSCIIPYNILYDDIRMNNPNLFDLLSKFFQKGLNIILYISFTIGFICSHKMKK